MCRPLFHIDQVCSVTKSFAASYTCSAPAAVCCATSVATRLTLSATDLARFVTPEAARATVLRLGRPSFRPPDLRAVEPRFAPRFAPPFRAGADRFAEALRPDDVPLEAFRPVLLRPLLLRAGPLRPALLRAGPFLPALLRAGPREPREPDFREADPLEEAFRPPERVPAFLPPFEPPRDDFLAAAMIRAPI